MRLYRAGIVFAAFASVPCMAWGSIITASGAGPLLPGAEDLSGVNVTEIQGSLTTDPTFVSLFKIDILNPLDFSAMTVDAGPFGIPDTELFLFDSSGNGIFFNDDVDGGNTLSCLPSADSANPCPVTAPGLGPASAGIYYLGIARSADGPVDGSNLEIFSNLLSTDIVGPNTGVAPLAGWDNGAYTQPNYDLENYDIILTGMAPATAPEPATWTLAAAALLTAGLFRGKLLRR